MSNHDPITLDDETPATPSPAPEPSGELPPHGCAACDAAEPTAREVAERQLDTIARFVHAQVAAMHGATDGSVTHVPTEAALLTISMNLSDITGALTDLSDILLASEAARQEERATMEARLERLITQGLALIATPAAAPVPSKPARKAPAKAVRRKSSTGKRAR